MIIKDIIKTKEQIENKIFKIKNPLLSNSTKRKVYVK